MLAATRFLVLAFGCLLTSIACAQSESQELPAVTTLDHVLVTGEHPGPGLWKVTKGENTLWILGMHTPLGKDIVWRSKDVEAVFVQSQLVLSWGGVKLDLDVDGGPIDMIRSVSAYSHLTKLPDGKKLVDVLPSDVYKKWAQLKSKYMGRDAGVEKKRPVFAAIELEKAAIKKAGFQNTRHDVVSDLLTRINKKHKAPVFAPGYKIAVHPNAKRSELIKGVSITPEQDMSCFLQTINGLEEKLITLKDRANAWATGNIEELTRLNQTEFPRPCGELLGMALMSSVDQGAELKQSSVDRIKKELERGNLHIQSRWISAAEQSLSKNKITFGLLSIHDLVATDGALAKLASKGYEVHAPTESAAH